MVSYGEVRHRKNKSDHGFQAIMGGKYCLDINVLFGMCDTGTDKHTYRVWCGCHHIDCDMYIVTYDM